MAQNHLISPFGLSWHVSSVIEDQVLLADLLSYQVLPSGFGDVTSLLWNVSLCGKGVYLWKPAVLVGKIKKRGNVFWMGKRLFCQPPICRIWVAADSRNKTTGQEEPRKTGDKIFCIGLEARSTQEFPRSL